MIKTESRNKNRDLHSKETKWSYFQGYALEFFFQRFRMETSFFIWLVVVFETAPSANMLHTKHDQFAIVVSASHMRTSTIAFVLTFVLTGFA